MKIKLITTLFFLSTILSYAQQRIITLEESVSIGIKNNKELKVAKSKVEQSKAKFNETGTSLLPTLKAGASYVRLSDVPPFEITTPFSPTPIKVQEPVLNNYNFGLSITQPLFTGFKLSSLKSASKKNYEAEVIQFNEEINKLTLSINEAFWNLYKAQKYVKLLTENKKRLSGHLKDTEEFFNNELVTKNDLLKVKSQLSNIEYQLVDANKNLTLARMLFNKTIGININEETEIKVDNTIEIENLKEVSVYINEALNNRNEIASTEKRIEAGDDLITAAQSDWFPTILLFGNFYYNRPNQRILPIKDEFNDTWDVGINLNWELWNWGRTSYKTEQAEQQYKQTKLMLDLLKENIQMEVYKNYLTVKSEYEKLEASNNLINSSEENYRITKEKYNAHAATSTELLDSEVEMLDAQIKQSNAVSDYKIAVKKLEVSIGRKIY